MNADVDISALQWSRERIGEALEALASSGGIELNQLDELFTPSRLEDDHVGLWAEKCAESLGVDLEPISVDYESIRSILRRGGPALLLLQVGEGSHALLALKRGRGRYAYFLTPRMIEQKVPIEGLFRAIVRHAEDSISAEVDDIVSSLAVPAKRRQAIRDTLDSKRLATLSQGEAWLVRQRMNGPWWPVLKHSGVPRRALAFFLAYLAHYGLSIITWWLIGSSALTGSLGSSWAMGWALLILSLVVLQVGTTWFSNLLAIDLGKVLKSRLLTGALSMSPDSVRHRGSGHAFGALTEAESIERLAQLGGLAGIMAVAEIVVTGFVLLEGRAGVLLVVLLLLWIALTSWLAKRYSRHLHRWTINRLEMTNDLVESMVGQRTRLVQESAERWHVREDRALTTYLTLGSAMDRSGAALVGLIPRGWVLVAMVGLLSSAVLTTSTIRSTAIAIGGVLLGYRALSRLTISLYRMAVALESWRRVRSIFAAASATPEPIKPKPTRTVQPGEVMLSAQDLRFQYAGRAEPVLEALDIQIRSGEHWLVDGGSGSGKSTLASLLAGLEQPTSGLVVLHGVDMHSLSTVERRRSVVLVPQFHENRILDGTLAFNLLCGKDWPARRGDFQEARQICVELGLGPLLERMPMGIHQMVGEIGWQLSHGEKCRVFMARAFLQDPEMIILDESLAALDPKTLEICLQAARQRAKTLMVIAHR